MILCLKIVLLFHRFQGYIFIHTTVTVVYDCLCHQPVSCFFFTFCVYDRLSNSVFFADFNGDVYSDLLKHIHERIRSNGHFVEASSVRKSVLRVAIDRLGTPLWPNADAEVPRFLYYLRAILRYAYSSCIITLPTSILKVRQ